LAAVLVNVNSEIKLIKRFGMKVQIFSTAMQVYGVCECTESLIYQPEVCTEVS
jgi:hypothetical protein